MIKAFIVSTKLLPEALREMNAPHMNDWTVRDVIVQGDSTVVLMNMITNYPFIENRWVSEFGVKNEDQ